MSLSAFVLVDAILLIGNHTISEYLRGVDAGDLANARRSFGELEVPLNGGRHGPLPDFCQGRVLVSPSDLRQ